MAIVVFFTILWQLLEMRNALLWLACSLSCFLYVFGQLYRKLGYNHPLGSETKGVYDNFGAANSITIFRGFLLCLLAGFLFLPRHPKDSFFAWLPAILYTVAIIADFFDGFVARKTGRSTELGFVLEGVFDSLGVLLAIALIVRLGKVPFWFAVSGGLSYLFQLGMWVRSKRGLPIFKLQHSFSGRVAAGFFMGYSSAALWPIIPARFIAGSGYLFFSLLTLSFLRDWLAVSGRIKITADWYQKLLAAANRRVLPILGLSLRPLVGLSVIMLFRHSGGMTLVFITILTVLIMLGIAGRLCSLGIVAFVVFGLSQITPWEMPTFLLLLSLSVVGTGLFSLWEPEKYLFSK